MKIEEVKAMMDLQADAYKSALQVFVSQSSDSIRGCEDLVRDLKRSLEFSQAQVDDMKSQIQSLQLHKETSTKVIDELRRELSQCREMMHGLSSRCNDLDDQYRRSNLKIDGLPESDNETSEQTIGSVSSLLREKLELPNLALETAHRTGQRYENRPRPVIVKFSRQIDRDAAFRNARKLKGSKIYLNEDLCPASQKIKAEQLPSLKAARAEGKLAYFVNTKLIIKEKNQHQRSNEDATRFYAGSATQEDALQTSSHNEAVTPTLDRTISKKMNKYEKRATRQTAGVPPK